MILIVMHCTDYMNGPNTVNKRVAEKQISKTIFLKSLSCGYNAARSFSISKLGNKEEYPVSWVKIGGDYSSNTITYDEKALKHCLLSLTVMPCPSNEIETDAGDKEYIATLILTRYKSCTFHSIEYWEINESIKGR
jgi:hypothetical protein